MGSVRKRRQGERVCQRKKKKRNLEKISPEIIKSFHSHCTILFHQTTRLQIAERG